MYILIDGKLTLCDKHIRTPEGYLLVEGLISRSGKQDYFGYEFNMKGADALKEIVVDRPVSEVIDEESVASFLNMPVTSDHPEGKTVDSKNHSKYSKGTVLEAHATESGHVKAKIIIYDEGLIQEIEAGKRELSAGYTSDLKFSDDGKSAIQTKIRGNHVAFVSAARCGKECRIFDSKPKEVNTMKLKIKGVEYEIADAASPAIQTLILDNEKAETKLADALKENEKSKAMLDAAHEKMQKMEDEDEDEDEKEKKIQDAASERLEVILSANKVIADFDAKGKTLIEIKKAVLADAFPDLDLKEKDVVYIDTRFEILCEDLKSKNTLNDALGTQMREGAVSNDMVADARAAKIKRSQSAYKGGK